MGIGEIRDALRIHDDFVIDDKVGDKLVDDNAIVEDIELFLLLDPVAALPQFDDE